MSDDRALAGDAAVVRASRRFAAGAWVAASILAPVLGEPQNAAHRDGMLAALAETARGPHFGLLARDLYDALANRAE